MERNTRMIVDYCIKDRSQKTFIGSPADQINKEMTAANDMYIWLYKEGILKKIAFEWKDYPDQVYFAFDVADLIQYRILMQKAPIENAMLAIELIFDRDLKKCVCTGGIQLGWPMHTYRNNNGCISRTLETSLTQILDNDAAREVQKVLRDQGPKCAIQKAFALNEWDVNQIEIIAKEIVSFIYDYDLFEYRDAFDSEEQAVDQMIADLSDPDQIVAIAEHLREFSETIEEKEHRDRIENLINKVINI